MMTKNGGNFCLEVVYLFVAISKRSNEVGLKINYKKTKIYAI